MPGGAGCPGARRPRTSRRRCWAPWPAWPPRTSCSPSRSFASQKAREGGAQLFSEFVAAFGLLAVIWGCAKLPAGMVAFGVGGYITAAYWFTASTSFANPAVTVARSLSDTFAGIRPVDVPGFIVAQLLGAGAATTLFEIGRASCRERVSM